MDWDYHIKDKEIFMKEQEISVLYAGKMSLNNMGGVDVGALEAHSGTIGFLRGISVKKGFYHCHYAIAENNRTIGALMLVHQDYEGDALIADEKIGAFNVGLSGIVGFFSSPKREYTMKQMGEYFRQLEREHTGLAWVVLNSKQFISPSAQAPATAVSVFAHRDRDGQIDALQMEFNRQENDLLVKGVDAA